MGQRRRGFGVSKWEARLGVREKYRCELTADELAFSTQHSANQGVAALKNFKDLRVWEKAHLLVLDAYRSANGFPKQELFGLTIQICRAGASIAANIAEGCGKRGNGEFQRFLNIATGSASELEYHLQLAHDLHFLNDCVYQSLNANVVEVKRMLASLARKIETEGLAG